GDFLSRVVSGTPLVVRNDGTRLRCFLNVCRHRHAVLVGAPCGNAARLRCQYHGWEYDDDGRLAKVPEAWAYLPTPRRGSLGLMELPLASCGGLVFVRLGPGPSLEDELGA